MRLLLLFLVSFFVNGLLVAQTGPAGVDNSTNNVLWLKADAGTSTTTNNAAVSSWTDQSGNSNSVSQATANQQPLYFSNAINGFPSIWFDNVSNTNDYLQGADASSLDNTAGLTILTVSKPENLDNSSPRSIISKRVNVDNQESYMFFYYTNNKMYTDVGNSTERFNTSAALTNTVNLVDLVYDGSLTSANRCKVYIAENLDVTSTEASSSLPDNASPLLIGATHSGDTRPFGGQIAEVIVYRKALNDAERIIVDNYLSAKYNITLSSNDKYAGDASGTDYDYGVAGIGQSASGKTNNAYSSSVSGGMGITYVSGFNDGDYILSGYQLQTNFQDNNDVGGMTGGGGNNARWARDFYVDVTNTSTVITTNIIFDQWDGGLPATPALGNANKYVLLYRAGTSGNWTELVVGASSVTGDQIAFNGVALSNDGYYTVGTQNYNSASLPVELLNFSAVAENEQVNLFWETATETNNKFFTIERSADAIHFTELGKINSKGSNGNSIIPLNYNFTDEKPLGGISYYRLKQTDNNGQFKYYNVVSVSLEKNIKFVLFPNPNQGEFNINFSGIENNHEVEIAITDMQGRTVYKTTILTDALKTNSFQIVPDRKLAGGKYFCEVTMEGIKHTIAMQVN